MVFFSRLALCIRKGRGMIYSKSREDTCVKPCISSKNHLIPLVMVDRTGPSQITSVESARAEQSRDLGGKKSSAWAPHTHRAPTQSKSSGCRYRSRCPTTPCPGCCYYRLPEGVFMELGGSFSVTYRIILLIVSEEFPFFLVSFCFSGSILLLANGGCFWFSFPCAIFYELMLTIICKMRSSELPLPHLLEHGVSKRQTCQCL